MPPIDSKQPAAGDRHHCRDGEVGQRVCCHMSDGGVGGEFEYHDHVLLHLILKHEGALWKETLLSRREKGGEEQKKKRKTEWKRRLGGGSR